MSEQLQPPRYIDIVNPDYVQLAELLNQYLDNSPPVESLTSLKGVNLVSTVIWWAKEANQADPQTVVTDIFGLDVWESKDWI